MTRKALHSAVLEVGLMYEKGWSEDHIARFTYRLNRRRLREQERLVRAQKAARLRMEPARLMVAYQIEEPQPEAQVAYEVTPLGADAKTARDRLVTRVRAQLAKRLSRTEETGDQGLLCAICGERATGWTYINRDEKGQRVTDGYATCAEHRSEEVVERLAGTRTR